MPYVFGTIFKKALRYKELFRYMSICEETETGQGFNDTKFHFCLFSFEFSLHLREIIFQRFNAILYTIQIIITYKTLFYKHLYENF